MSPTPRPAKRARLSNRAPASMGGIASTSVAEHPSPKKPSTRIERYNYENFPPVHNVMTFEPGRTIRVSAPDDGSMLTWFRGEFGRTGPETEHAMLEEGYITDLVVVLNKTAKTTVVNTAKWSSDFAATVWAPLPTEVRELIVAAAAPELPPGEGPWIESFADLLKVMRKYELWYRLSSWPEHRLSPKAFDSRFHATLVQHCRFKAQRTHRDADEFMVDPVTPTPTVLVRTAMNAVNPRVNFPCIAPPPYLRNPRLLGLGAGPGINPSAAPLRLPRMNVYGSRVALYMTRVLLSLRATKADVDAVRTFARQCLPNVNHVTLQLNLQLLLDGPYTEWGNVHRAPSRFAADHEAYLDDVFGEDGTVSLDMNPRYAGHQVVCFGSVDEDFSRKHAGTLKRLHERMYEAFRFPRLADPRQDPGWDGFLPGTLDPAERDAEEDEYADEENQEWSLSWRTWRTM